ncbi:ATP-binding cassette domain-containing protein [Bifidobacterium boum]|uniref:ATP-binding cassette domain-containing protein n=1 Tax=Bifidobacterium boum TaxID=78343 RepID=UPI0039940B97
MTFSYRGADVLKDVNLTLTGGSVVGVVGPNGVGKTTLLSILVGDLIPDNGTVRINGTMVDGISDRSKVFGIALPTHPPLQ